MLVKTFKAGDMAEALKMVKAELGADAMILSSRKERKRGILGIFSKPYFEVTAALDPRPAVAKPNPYREKEERELTTKEEFQNSMLGPLARELRELRDRVEKLTVKEPAPAQAPTTTVEQTEETVVAPLAAEPAVENGPGREIATRFSKEDMEEIKKYLLGMVNSRDKKGAVPVSFPAEKRTTVADEELPVVDQEDSRSALEQLNDALRRGGVGEEAAVQLIDYIRPAAERGEDREELRYSLFEAFAQLIKCAGPLRLKKDNARIMGLVGPTGVGKTTTTAKLAAMYAMNKGADVALITIDNFRVGAVEQLKTYSKIMGIPLDVAATPAELKKALDKHRDKDLILVDTAGRSPKDQDKLDELKAFFEVEEGMELHLCLSSTTKDQDLEEIVQRFSILPITKLLFTKLDECATLGCIVNIHLKTKLPLSYFTNGQMVPEDIAVASPRRLANLIVQERP
jgi:flagellar biosynthesis protein FlhF